MQNEASICTNLRRTGWQHEMKGQKAENGINLRRGNRIKQTWRCTNLNGIVKARSTEQKSGVASWH